MQCNVVDSLTSLHLVSNTQVHGKLITTSTMYFHFYKVTESACRSFYYTYTYSTVPYTVFVLYAFLLNHKLITIRSVLFYSLLFSRCVYVHNNQRN